jgi:PAS domain S-box-containing protein
MAIEYGHMKPSASFEAEDFDDLRDFVESLGIGVHWVGPDGTILRANRVDYESLGYRAEEFIGRKIGEFWVDPEEAAGFLDRLRKGETFRRYRTALRCSDGSLRHVLIDSSALFRDGEFVHSRCLVRDGTARVRAEETQRATERLAADIFDALPVLISYVDSERRYRFNSRTYEEWFGRPRSEITGRTMPEVLGEAAFRVIDPHVRAALAGSPITYEALVPYGGGERWIKASYVPDRAPDGLVRGFFAIVEDIGERIRANQFVQSVGELLSIALDTAELGPWQLDLRTNELSCTAQCKANFGRDPEAPFTHQDFLAAIHPDDAATWNESFQRAIEQRQDAVTQLRIILPDGTLRWIEVRGRCAYHDDGTPTLMRGVTLNITQRVQAEHALRTSENRYRTLAETLPSYVAQFDSQARASYLNERWLTLTGRTFEEMRGLRWTQVIHPDDLPTIERELRAASAERRQSQFEYRVHAADGSWRWFLGTTAPVRGVDGEATTYIAASADITDRKRAEVALRESERRYRELVEAIDVAVYTTDVDGRITQFNDAATKLWGRHPLVGVDRWCGSARMYWPNGSPMSHDESPLALTLKHGLPVRGFEVIAERPDGTRVQFVPYPTPLRDATGKLVGAVNVLVDITERKRAEDALRASEARKRAIVETAVDGIVTIDERGTIESFNPAAERLFGYTAAEVVGRNIKILMPEPYLRDHDDFLERYLRTGEKRVIGVGRDVEGRRKGGSVFPISLAVSEVVLGGKRSFTGIVHDLSQRKETEEALDRERQRLSAMFRSASAGIVQLDGEMRFSFTNDRFCEIVGRARGEVLSAGYNDFTHEQDRAQVSVVMETLSYSDEFSLETRYVRPDGSIVWVHNSVSAIRDSAGALAGAVAVCIDITDRKRAEDALAETESRFRTVSNNAPVLIWMAGPDKQCTWFNDPWLRFRGRTLDEEIGYGWAEGVHPEDLDRVVRTYEDAFDRREAYEMEYRLLHHDGTYRWIVDRGAPLYTPGGEFTGYVGGCIDIEERKRAAEAELRAAAAVRREQALLDAMFRALPIGLTFIDRDYRYVRINQALAEVNGLPVEGHEGKTVADVAPEIFPVLKPLFDRALAGESLKGIEISAEAPGERGPMRHWLAGFYPVEDISGQVIGLAESVVEITDRKRAEDALAYQFGLTSTIADNASVGLMMLDRDGKVTFLNPAGEILTGYRFDDIKGETAHDKMHFLYPDGRPYPVTQCPIDRANASATMLADYEDIFVRPDGTFYNVRLNVAPIVTEGEHTGALIEIRDVTEEKRAEARARFLAEAAEALNASLEYDRMLADLAKRAVPRVADVAVVGVFAGGPATLRLGTAVAEGSDAGLVSAIHLRRWPAGDGSGRSVEDVMFAGETLLIEDAETWIERFAPDDQQRQAARDLAPRSVLSAPLVVRGQAAGMMTFAVTRSGRRYGEGDREMVSELARRAGLALENARLYGELQETAARERILSEARRALGQTLDEHDQLLALVELVVPAAADICVITRFEPDGRSVVHFGPSGASDDERSLVAQIRLREWRPPGDERHLGAVLSALQPVLVEDVPAWIEGCAPDQAQREAARALGLRSLIAVPLAARGQPIGAMIWLRRQGRNPYGTQDVQLAQEIARRAGTSIENARLYRELELRAQELARANAAKDEFLGLVSHELKTPITTIYGNAEVLERRGTTLPAEVQAGAILDIRVESERLHRIVDNLLVLARLERGQQLDVEPVLVRRVAQRIVADHKRRFPGRRVDLHASSVAPALAVPEYIDQVLRNLLSNAEKYSPPDTSIDITFEIEGETFAVRVLDRGQGIPESELENVFTPFYRSPRTSAAPGAGIGLAVCKRLIEAQSGTIWARPREGGGTEFGFALPVARDE